MNYFIFDCFMFIVVYVVNQFSLAGAKHRRTKK